MRLIAQLYAFIAGNIDGKGKRETYKGGNRCIFMNSLGSRVQTLQNKLHPLYFTYIQMHFICAILFVPYEIIMSFLFFINYIFLKL